MGKNGLSPIELSVIVDKKRTVLTLDKRIKPNTWKAQSQKSSQKEVNKFIDAIRAKFYSIETELIKRGISVTLENVTDAYKNGFKVKEVGIIEFFNAYNREKGKNLSLSLITILKYKNVMDCLKSFIVEKYGKQDMPLASITPLFLQRFYDHLLTFNANNSAVGKMRKLKSVLSFAVDEGHITKNPMTMKFHLDKVHKKPLNDIEVAAIEAFESPIERINKVKDLFLFQCYTALSYSDMASIKKEDILESEYGKYIQKNRNKTNVQYTCLLNDKAIEILERYDYQLPILSNQKYNSYLAEIRDILGIKKPLTSHIARHTAATRFLNNGIPISVVSKILGHTNTRQTEAYAKMLDSTVLKEMASLRSAL